MERMIAYCGLICTDCGAYQATQAKDMDWLERVAAQWREEFHTDGLTVDTIKCDGCLSSGGQMCSHCFECGYRQCGLERGVANCGECSDYQSCEKIQSFFTHVPDAKKVLDEVYAAKF